MSTKTVLDVGNCGPDHAAIRSMLVDRFDANVLQTDGLDDTLQALGGEQIDLVLINRKLDQDYSDGTVILEAIRADERFANVPVMIVTNYQEHQDAAVKLGAVPGFGKLALNRPETQQRLSQYLS